MSASQKKRLLLLLILFVIGVFVISGCGLGEKAVTQQAGQQTPTTPAGKSGITREMELEVCAGMPQVGEMPLEVFCLIGLAAKHKDVALCSKVTFSGDIRKACYSVVAQASKNVAICEEAGSFKDSCYREYARNTKDASVCDKITDVYEKDNCYSDAANTLADASFCEKIKVVPNKDNCYQNMAMRLQDKTYCDKISSASIKQNCDQNIQGIYPVERAVR